MEKGMKFSTQLIERLVQYFKMEYDKDISVEEADVFFGSLATVYDSLNEKPYAQ